MEGVAANNRRHQFDLYTYCADYFWDNYRGMFFVNEKDADEILQNSFIAFWENIERHKVYVENGVIMGKNKEPFKGSITTYFMSIAENKYKEWVRDKKRMKNPLTGNIEDVNIKEWIKQKEDFESQSDELDLWEIVAECISKMSPRCNEILTKFYYEEKKLDVILKEIPAIDSYKALKSKKHKCMETLRKSANEMYHRGLCF